MIGVVVPESDFRENLDGPRDTAIAIAGLALVIALLVGRRLSRAVDAEIEVAADRARRLGQYTLEGRIGEGGMGAVYRARHAMLRRPTAIKLLRADQAGSAQALRRFESEVQQSALLTHPNTIRIYDYGRTPDNVFYYAMELLDGVTLEDVVAATGPMEPARVIHILRQVCGSLQEAHTAGLVHRDVKPANLMLCRQGGAPDFVKVLDFGLVKSLDGDSDDSAAAHDIAGSPRYLAPESVTDPNGVDGRADLYAVGAVGYFLLTGTPVVAGETMGELLTSLLQTVPERPSERTGTALPKDLEDVLLACLEKSPDDRPPTAADLATRLEACDAADDWNAARAQEWWADNAGRLSAVWSGTVISSATPGPLTIDLRARDVGDAVRGEPSDDG